MIWKDLSVSITGGTGSFGFGCTPFYLDAVEELEPFVDLYKIASYELLLG